MRISEVCSRAHLTECAVRLYIREGLVHPGQRNGIAVFDADGITRIEQIAVLRRADFSIDQIKRMLDRPDEVGAVIDEKKNQLSRQAAEELALLSVLNAPETIDSVEQLVQTIRSAEVPAPEPIRTSFDEPLPNESEIEQAWQQINAAERRRARHRKLIPVYIVAALAILIALFVLYEKFDVYAAQNSDSYPYLQQKLREILEQRDRGIILPDQ